MPGVVSLSDNMRRLRRNKHASTRVQLAQCIPRSKRWITREALKTRARRNMRNNLMIRMSTALRASAGSTLVVGLVAATVAAPPLWIGSE